MRPSLASTLALAALLAPVLACLGYTENDTTTTGSTGSTTEVTTGAETCDKDGLCEPAAGENAANCMEDCFCGDGVKESGEACEDGNNTPGDGCDPMCKPEATKCDNDGVKEDGEACDDGNAANTDACLTSCNVPSCGDGFEFAAPLGTEECDQGADNGNTKACTLACKLATCGDNFVQAGVEDCDDGEMNGDTAACTSQCKNATCGDGFVQAGEEACDDGNAAEDDACAFDCKNTFCGDGTKQAPNGDGIDEACDDGNTDETDDCGAQCQTIVHRKVFLSSGAYSGNALGLNGLAGANAKCNALAEPAGLTGKFKAWLSDSIDSPSTRFDTTFTGIYELPNGTIVAKGWIGLTTSDLENAIDTTEVNTVLPNDTPVWTNTAPTGAPLDKSCTDWKGAGGGAIGVISSASPDWTDIMATNVCGGEVRIYCFEDPK